MWWKEKSVCGEILYFLTEGASCVVREGFRHKADGGLEPEEEGAAFVKFAPFAGTAFDGTEEFFLMIGEPGEKFTGAAVFEPVDVAAFFAIPRGTVGATVFILPIPRRTPLL